MLLLIVIATTPHSARPRTQTGDRGTGGGSEGETKRKALPPFAKLTNEVQRILWGGKREKEV